MNKALLWFEIKNRLQALSSLIYFALFFLFAFLMALLLGDAFPDITVNFGLSGKLPLNCPTTIHAITTYLGYIGILISAPIFGQAINKDFESGFAPILFSTPIKKFTYFFVRYLGSTISVVAILSSIGLGIWAATFWPSTFKMPNSLFSYLAPYLQIVIPNVLCFGALYLVLVATVKKMSPVYVAGILIFTLVSLSRMLFKDIETEWIASLIDPTGIVAAKYLTQFWSIAEQKSQTIPFTGYLLYNRLIWLAISSAILLLGYRFFNPFKIKNERRIKQESSSSFSYAKTASALTPNSRKVLWQLSLFDFKLAFSNLYFLILLLCGIIFLCISSTAVGKLFGTTTLPVTYHVLEVTTSSFQFFILLMTTYYAGELVWKERELKFYEISDCKPVSNLFRYLSKLLSLIFIQCFLCLVILFTSIAIQIAHGYYHFEFSIYFQYLSFYFLLPNILNAVLTLFIHTLSKNKYLGHSAVILYIFVLGALPLLGVTHPLLLTGLLPPAIYSDMNRFGSSFAPFALIISYWILFHFALGIVTLVFWRRGFTRLKMHLSPPYKKALLFSLLGFGLLGSIIFYNTNILNSFKSRTTKLKEFIDYELAYKKFEKLPQPEITSVSVNIDLFPEKESMQAKGVFKYLNRTEKPVTQLLLNTSEKAEIQNLSWSRTATVHSESERLGIIIFDLEKPLLPNEEISLAFDVGVKPHGLSFSGMQTKIYGNGTFFYGADYFPVLGYCPGKELESVKDRKKHNLPEKRKMYPIDDKEAVNKTYFSEEGAWIDFEATISTSADQKAIAPGYLQSEWEENGRRYFHYKMDRPILNFYAFLSGRYAVASDEWNGVKIEIYHHPQHTHNIARMIQAMKSSLDYYTKNFSPYQYRQLRIIEFPRYISLAQSFPNTIPYSESLGFIAKLDDSDPENIDYVFYVTAHEVAHQWWGHQVVGGNVQGATMLSESLAQYSALMVQEKEYGPEQMAKFLQYERNFYLGGRRTESQRELPLMLNEGQDYIHYHKGSLIFYALKDYLGEDLVNQVLREYIQDVAYQSAPFTRSVDLVERFKQAAPEDKKYLIEDFFETITFYTNRILSVTYTKQNDKYLVEITSENKKFRASELGEETEIPMNDLMDIGIFDADRNALFLEKKPLLSGKNTFLITLDQEPAAAGIDPYHKLIDKDSFDHVIKAKKQI